MADTSPDFLRQQARRLRRLAREIVDEHAQQELLKLAEEYERRAAAAAKDGNGH